MEKDGTEMNQGRHHAHEDGGVQPRSQDPGTTGPLAGRFGVLSPFPRQRAGIGPSVFPYVC
ncbi:hypothetical protein GCM10010345_24060 [Streptomyces canarius]|uniref:Uncharacterized protein n=1 Tax=Streptomyces canarius TaxID=285453 RepID=A0ABQ3CL38_9ACTN|nr:hypothetical protein GCM10010345_24060 [Streptomyces canarius]